ncbi:MAG: flavodoxin [Paludibacteraceae bacterium]
MRNILISAITALLSIVACGQNQRNMNTSKTLVAWFSWSGNTEAVVKHIAEKTGADLFRIEREKPYPTQYDPCTVDAKNEVDNNVFPSIKGIPENFGKYDTVIVAVPVWWYTAPMPVRTFLEKSGLDWSGKTVIPLCTAYTAEYNTLKDIVKATPEAEHLEGLAVITTKMNGEDIDRKYPQIDAWLNKLNLVK